MNRKWGICVLLAVFTLTILASAVRTTSPAPIGDIPTNEGLVAPSTNTANSELDRTNTTNFIGGHAAEQRAHIPFQPVNNPGLNDLFVSIDNLRIRESSFLVKDYLFFIYPSHHFW